jgi:hypothetical protein
MRILQLRYTFHDDSGRGGITVDVDNDVRCILFRPFLRRKKHEVYTLSAVRKKAGGKTCGR